MSVRAESYRRGMRDAPVKSEEANAGDMSASEGLDVAKVDANALWILVRGRRKRSRETS